MLYSVNLLDLKVFYFENYRKIFGFTCGLMLLAILDEVFIRNTDWSNVIFKSFLLATMIFLISRKTLAEWAHPFIAVLFLLLMVLSIIVEWNVWLIGG